MKDRIRRWLGIEQLYIELTSIQGPLVLQQRLTAEANTKLSAIGPGLGRVIAKLDPMFGRDELDPTRKAESDKLGSDVMKHLTGDYLARQAMEGKGT